VLGAVQGLWAEVAGAAVAAQAAPVAEREGVVTIACRSAVWAQELDLLGGELLRRLNEALPTDRGPISGLRFTADAARHE
jgi:predicted nucleic acid-binding Zn ribbon protein